jgi:hypothetical protein
MQTARQDKWIKIMPRDRACVVRSVERESYRLVDVTETDAFRVVVVQDLDGVAIEDGGDGAGRKQRLVSFLYSESGTLRIR